MHGFQDINSFRTELPAIGGIIGVSIHGAICHLLRGARHTLRKDEYRRSGNNGNGWFLASLIFSISSEEKWNLPSAPLIKVGSGGSKNTPGKNIFWRMLLAFSHLKRGLVDRVLSSLLFLGHFSLSFRELSLRSTLAFVLAHTNRVSKLHIDVSVFHHLGNILDRDTRLMGPGGKGSTKRQPIRTRDFRSIAGGIYIPPEDNSGRICSPNGQRISSPTTKEESVEVLLVHPGDPRAS